MTRLFTTGFEMGDMLSLDLVSNNLPVISSTLPRSGVYAMSCPSANQCFGQKSFSAVSEFYLRAGLYVAALPSTTAAFIRWLGVSDAFTSGALRINNTSGNWEFVTVSQINGTETLVATSTRPVILSSWQLVEIRVKIDDTVGVFDLKIDGVSAISAYSGDTKTGSATMTAVQIGKPISVSWGATMYVDDIAINDTDNADGLNDNSWCGDGKVLYIAANGAGDVTQLTASAGSNYQCVDDVPPNTTDYVSSNTADQYDLYNLATLSPALTAGQTILRVWPECRALEEAAAGDNIALGIKPSGGSEDWSSDIPVTSTYNRYVGKHYKTDPSDAGAWTEADVNALQAGVKVR